MAYLTDSELIERYEFYTMQLEQRLLDGEDYRDVVDQIPSVAILSRKEDIKIIHTNKRHQEVTGYSTEQVKKECPYYLNDIIHPDSLEYVRNFLPAFYRSENHYKTTVFIQYARLYGQSDYTPLITFAKPSRIPDDLVLRTPLLISELEKLSPKMEQIVKMDQFRLKHFRLFQELTAREIEILKMLANGHNNAQISDELFLSRQTVETHRKHLKRKLNLTSFLDLMRYAFAFNLVECK